MGGTKQKVIMEISVEMKRERISRRVKLRNPFRITRLSWALRFYVHYLDSHSRLPMGLNVLISSKWAHRIFRLSRKLNAGTKGEVEFSHHKKLTLEFNGRNTQFVTLYHPRARYGYEPFLCALLDWLVPDDGTFLDVGSNWGYFGLYLASRPGFEGTIYCFEPFPESFNDLASVVKQARLDDCVRCVRLGLSYETRGAKMVLPNGVDSGLAQVVVGANQQGRDVQLVSLDEFAGDRAISRIDFIKYDVEGSEHDALLGSRSSILRFKPMIVLENWKYPAEPAKTLGPLSLLQQLEYLLFIPTWQETVFETPVILDQEPELTMEAGTLTLVPLQWEDRFLFESRVNLFACHSSRLPDLKG